MTRYLLVRGEERRTPDDTPVIPSRQPTMRPAMTLDIEDLFRTDEDAPPPTAPRQTLAALWAGVMNDYPETRPAPPNRPERRATQPMGSVR